MAWWRPTVLLAGWPLSAALGCSSIAGLDGLTTDRPDSSSTGGAGGHSGGAGGAPGGSAGGVVGGVGGAGGGGGSGGVELPDEVLCANALPQDTGEWEWMRGAAWDHDDGVVVVGGIRGSFESFGIETPVDEDRQILVARLDASCQPTYVKLWGGTGFDIGHGVAIDSFGNAVVTGEYRGSATFDTSTLPAAGDGAELFVAKISPAGQLLWVRGFGGVDADSGKRVAVGNDGSIVVTGGFKGTLTIGDTMMTSVIDPLKPNPWDPFVVKLDASGNVQWATSFEGEGWQQIDSVAIDPSGVVVVGGGMEHTLTVGSTVLTAKERSDAFVALLDAGGTPIWARSMGGEPNIDKWDHAAENVRNVGFAPNGEIVALIKHRQPIDLGMAGMLQGADSPANARITLHPATGDSLTAMTLGEADGGQMRVSGIETPSSMTSARLVAQPIPMTAEVPISRGTHELTVSLHGSGGEVTSEVSFPLGGYFGWPSRWIGAHPWVRIPAAVRSETGDIFVMLTSAPASGLAEPFLQGRRTGAFFARIRP